MPEANVAEVLAGIEMSPAESPPQLRARAAALDGDLRTAIAATGRLGLEAAALRARAVAIEHRDAARQPVQEAEEAVAAAQAAYDATAAPEVEATRYAVEARQAFEAARDALEDAQRGQVSPADEIEMEAATEAGARVDERRLQVLARAQQARVLAKRDLDRARARLARAQAGLEAAEEDLANPRPGAGAPGELHARLLHCWPTRFLDALTGAGPPLNDAELEACRDLARRFADLLGVVPAGAAQRLEQRAAAAALQEVRQRMHQVAIVGPGGQALNLGQLMGLPAGAAGG
jgi:hypothetical protein